MTKSLKELLAQIVTWIKTPWIHSSTPNRDVGFRVTRDDTNVNVLFGIGSGGVHHGVWSTNLNKWLVYGDASTVYVNNYDMSKSHIDITWNSGTAGTARADKWGAMVTLTISNPTKLATGSNIVFTLPEGYRPMNLQYMNLTSPQASTSANVYGLSLRAMIYPNGQVQIYNYRSTAITSDTNASATVTYVAVG
jgi:hypothetical protein